MAEAEQIARGGRPITVDSLTRDLLSLEVRSGDVVLVHASLSSLGWVNGGPVAVIEALLRAVGPEGTIVMPAQSANLSDPANWGAPPVPASWHQTIRETMPTYDPGTNAFLPIGASALRSGMAAAGALGEGRGILVGMRQIVDHAVELWTSGR